MSIHVTCLYIACLQGLAGRQAQKVGPWGFLWFLLQAEVAAPRGAAEVR